MIFTLEALEAKHGDALLLHFGTIKKPSLIVIDGGPEGVYRATLKPRLEQLRTSRAGTGALQIRMVMISHIDDDHINGVLQMITELDELRADRKSQPYDVLTLWHNSFDDILGNEGEVLTSNLKGAASAASTGGSMPPGLPIHRDAALVVASVSQGRELRNHAKALSLDINEGFTDLIGVPERQKSRSLSLGGGLSLTVIGPRKQNVDDLRRRWDKDIKKLGVAQQASFVDDSVFNLSSLIVLAKSGKQTMLLTGDARGDEILTGLQEANLLKKGRCHVDLLKAPHHGSDRNVSTEFFRQVTADHYVISGNGRFGNPEIAMLKMLSSAREDDRFTIHLTNPEARLTTFFAKEKAAGRKYKVVFRQPKALSVSVGLGDSLKD